MPHLVLGGITGDPRLPLWILRAVLAGAAAAGFTIWLGWRLGLTIAVIVVVLDTLYRSRTTSVIPADVRVTFAQRRTRRRLRVLRNSGYLSLHQRAIPGTQSVIDHLVIGPGGVFAVDSELWDRRLPIRSFRAAKSAKPGQSGMLYHGPYSQKERLGHARWEAEHASALLSEDLGRGIETQPAMVIYGPTVPWVVATMDGVDVLSGGRIRMYFARRTRMIPRAERMDRDQVAEIYAAADGLLPPAHDRGLNYH